MKFGFRVPSLTKRIAALTSIPRFVSHSLGVKAPLGMGWVTNPKKFVYNKVYNKTSRGCMLNLVFIVAIPAAILYFVLR